jgi:hypothetical protein
MVLLSPVVTLSRTSLSLAPLVLGGPDQRYQFFGADQSDTAVRFEGTSWSKQFAESPWTHGDAMVSARKVNSRLSLGFWVVGTNLQEVDLYVDDVSKALEQFSYNLTISYETVTHPLRAFVGDWNVGITRPHLWSFTAPLIATIPTLPPGIGL